ncbi:hypothetical protein AXK11_08220 [Cephaloticoccus primus]|uniref:Endonuclease/exonuclease/phosphatase domain-containing protein n=1 Tax=Cephaloticoccus primus TaxID=1548207 RepID=A0A139SJ47_9BACT|nr:endonuclease/exonuclease/phosphatase family protein [Cephaloticoccus primus]KXU34500.1 hypothetical protein AXK11_08220 [Cephaloticoccus primus]
MCPNHCPRSASKAAFRALLRCLFWVAIFALFPSQNGTAKEPFPPPETTLPARLKIATYNIENYNATSRRTPLGFRTGYPKSEAAKRALRQVIRQIDADVLVLQEMGPVEYLIELQRDLRSEGLFYPHTALVRGPDAQRHVAALSRFPFAEVHEHTPLRFRYRDSHEDVKRGLLELRFATAAGPLAIWALHLKSRYSRDAADPESAALRTGEARRIRDFILQRIASTDTRFYLILGDFNDTKASPPLGALQQRGKVRLSHLLDAADSRGESWTYRNAREDSYWRVDHILASPKLLPAVSGARATIADAPEVRDASDHRPLSVTLDLAQLPAITPKEEERPSSAAAASN